jgi:hypothetical protein
MHRLGIDFESGDDGKIIRVEISGRSRMSNRIKVFKLLMTMQILVEVKKKDRNRR